MIKTWPYQIKSFNQIMAASQTIENQKIREASNSDVIFTHSVYGCISGCIWLQTSRKYVRAYSFWWPASSSSSTSPLQALSLQISPFWSDFPWMFAEGPEAGSWDVIGRT